MSTIGKFSSQSEFDLQAGWKDFQEQVGRISKSYEITAGFGYTYLDKISVWKAFHVYTTVILFQCLSMHRTSFLSPRRIVLQQNLLWRTVAAGGFLKARRLVLRSTRKYAPASTNQWKLLKTHAFVWWVKRSTFTVADMQPLGNHCLLPNFNVPLSNNRARSMESWVSVKELQWLHWSCICSL